MSAISNDLKDYTPDELFSEIERRGLDARVRWCERLRTERDAAVRLAEQRAGALDELRQRNLRALKLLGGLWQDVAMGLGTANEWYATMRLAVEEAVTGNLAAALRVPSGQQDATKEPS